MREGGKWKEVVRSRNLKEERRTKIRVQTREISNERAGVPLDARVEGKKAALEKKLVEREMVVVVGEVPFYRIPALAARRLWQRWNGDIQFTLEIWRHIHWRNELRR